MSMEDWWNDTERGKPEYLEKKQSQKTLSTTHPTWTGLEWNLGLCGDCLPVPWHDQGVGGRHARGRQEKKKKLRGLSPRANYTDRAAAAGRRS